MPGETFLGLLLRLVLNVQVCDCSRLPLGVLFYFWADREGDNQQKGLGLVRQWDETAL